MVTVSLTELYKTVESEISPISYIAYVTPETFEELKEAVEIFNNITGTPDEIVLNVVSRSDVIREEKYIKILIKKDDKKDKNKKFKKKLIYYTKEGFFEEVFRFRKIEHMHLYAQRIKEEMGKLKKMEQEREENKKESFLKNLFNKAKNVFKNLFNGFKKRKKKLVNDLFEIKEILEALIENNKKRKELLEKRIEILKTIIETKRKIVGLKRKKLELLEKLEKLERDEKEDNPIKLKEEDNSKDHPIKLKDKTKEIFKNIFKRKL